MKFSGVEFVVVCLLPLSSRAATVKKYTKKGNARAELLFWLLSLLFFLFFVFFLTFSLPSPLSLLKLSNDWAQERIRFVCVGP